MLELFHHVRAAVIAVPGISKMNKSKNIDIRDSDPYADLYAEICESDETYTGWNWYEYKWGYIMNDRSRLAARWPSLCPVSESSAWQEARDNHQNMLPIVVYYALGEIGLIRAESKERGLAAILTHIGCQKFWLVSLKNTSLSRRVCNKELLG